MLRRRKPLRRCAASKTVVHASRSGNDTLKDQVAAEASVRRCDLMGRFRRFHLLSEMVPFGSFPALIHRYPGILFFIGSTCSDNAIRTDVEL